jgi:hypothetical protein
VIHEDEEAEGQGRYMRFYPPVLGYHLSKRIPQYRERVKTYKST